jgi:hypothetical protein
MFSAFAPFLSFVFGGGGTAMRASFEGFFVNVTNLLGERTWRA